MRPLHRSHAHAWFGGQGCRVTLCSYCYITLRCVSINSMLCNRFIQGALMKLQLAVTLVGFCLAQGAIAQEIASFETKDVKKAVQCEFGQFAKEFYAHIRKPPSVEGLVELSLQTIVAKTGQVGVTFG